VTYTSEKRQHIAAITPRLSSRDIDERAPADANTEPDVQYHTEPINRMNYRALAFLLGILLIGKYAYDWLLWKGYV